MAKQRTTPVLIVALTIYAILGQLVFGAFALGAHAAGQSGPGADLCVQESSGLQRSPPSSKHGTEPHRLCCILAMQAQQPLNAVLPTTAITPFASEWSAKTVTWPIHAIANGTQAGPPRPPARAPPFLNS